MYTVLSARKPRWSDLAHTSIVLLVLFEEFKDLYGEVPFAASPKDTESYGVDLFNRAVAGEFGDVLEPDEQTTQALVTLRRDDLSAIATARINELATELDMLQDAIALKRATETQLNALPAVQAELNAFRLYRVELAQLETLAGYPDKFEWPIAPAKPFVYAPVEEPVPVQGSEDEQSKI
ncbi:tail fiber assembly protein [Pseudomonas viridiflava]|uniref:phage tail protein n=1 Tax=Pseudomonas viridiflava TaxID=33069 RepID=UPI0015E3E4DD|nr:phage tail protein [Pseudomonas viridiflava]MBA1231152.1 tail fiber assembly protein [Pseudomonas viridiflava]